MEQKAEKLLTRVEAGRYCGLSPFTLGNLAAAQLGPPYIKVQGRRVRYRQADLDAWLKSRADRQPK